MTKRAAVLVAAAMLLAAPVFSQAATKAPKKKGKAAASLVKKVDAPAPLPDNSILPADNGARAQSPAVSLPPEPIEKKEAEVVDNAAAALGKDAEYNSRLLAQAIRMGILRKGVPPAALTPDVMNRMIDAHVLKDAVSHGLLPANASPSQVTPEIRAVMKKGGYFVHYYPDGSVNQNYGNRQ